MLLIKNTKIIIMRKPRIAILLLCFVLFVVLNNNNSVSSFTILRTNNYYSNIINDINNINYEIYPNQCLPTKDKRKSLTSSTTTISSSSSVVRMGTSTLYMSLKPAALLLMDSGKSLARCGELLIDYTKELESNTNTNTINYNNLGNAGAQIRNAGDCLAQVGASCRFKTGIELVIDELRECATCLLESSKKINSQIQIFDYDNNNNNNNNNDDTLLQLKRTLELACPIIKECSIILEATGEGIMKRIPIIEIGSNLVLASEQLFQLSIVFQELQQQQTEQSTTAQTPIILKECIIKLTSSADTMKLAGNQLNGNVEQNSNKSGRSFLKGGM